MPKPFRAQTKEDPGGRIPKPLAHRLRVRAAREKRSISWVMTETIARGMGIDPSQYGIEAEPVESASS